MKQKILTLICAAAFVSGCQPAPSEHAKPTTQSVPDDQGSWHALRSAEFPENCPTEEAADRLHDEMLFHRSTQVVLWSLPAMTTNSRSDAGNLKLGGGKVRHKRIEKFNNFKS
jgi:hypothetical protein